MAAPSSSTSTWAPTPGSYEVNLGLNLRNALKARKGSPKENRKFPKREIYSIRCQYLFPLLLPVCSVMRCVTYTYMWVSMWIAAL